MSLAALLPELGQVYVKAGGRGLRRGGPWAQMLRPHVQGLGKPCTWLGKMTNTAEQCL